ncbi:alpha/beta fold hydrolase [Bacillus massiliigorillae]|uniref:alpha/beta fold hydrolase n=1 Tax=Bacillus massiliigorillae TaxID=1243664 RepID=UPI00039F3FCC|nr:alpha/beta hydrolase [Bacillus massiliigorillae]
MAQPISKIVKVNENVSFEVEIAGQGEPVVFLHNIEGLKWNQFLDELSNHYQVYAPHLPGTGASTGLETIRDLWDLILCYYDLFDELGLESAHVIGHSLGGMIAAELAATDQSRVKQLVAIAPTGLFMEEHPIPDMFAMLPEELIRLVVLNQDSPAAQMMRYVPEDIDERTELMIQRISNQVAAAKFLWPIPDKGLKSRIHRIKAQTLLIWGKQDGLIPVVYGEEFRSRIANSELKVIENASHLVDVEQTEEVITFIRDFLKTSSVVHR